MNDGNIMKKWKRCQMEMVGENGGENGVSSFLPIKDMRGKWCQFIFANQRHAQGEELLKN
jgi:hypothetical protein